MKIRIYIEIDKFFDVYADSVTIHNGVLRLFNNYAYDDEEVARPPETKLSGAYWGIMGFVVLEEE